MLKWVLIAVVVVVVAIALFVAWMIRAARVKGERSYAALLARIAPVAERLAAGRDPDPADLERFAADRATRRVLYDALDHHGKLALFPAAHLTQDAMAEADLVQWLHHPNELGAVPDEIEKMAEVPLRGGLFEGQTYILFRYRTSEPHWAARDGWMAGVAGPYPVGAPVIASAPGTFSRFEAYDKRTPDEHVHVTHALVVERDAGEAEDR